VELRTSARLSPHAILRFVAKTLFFVEAAILAALSLVFPLIAREASAAFVVPLAASLLIPAACILAAWPLRSVYRALRGAFAGAMPARAGDDGRDAALESARILDDLGGFSRTATALGLILAFASILRELPSVMSLDTWAYLGAYLALYALVSATLWQILATIWRRSVRSRAEATSPPRPDFAARYGLSPREAETAILISSGLSYKEAAYALGITLRTVKAHMGAAYGKTGTSSNVALALKMREEGAIGQRSNGAIEAEGR
jgi:DNA-binding CsgD family transcriptional regulator